MTNGGQMLSDHGPKKAKKEHKKPEIRKEPAGKEARRTSKSQG